MTITFPPFLTLVGFVGLIALCAAVGFWIGGLIMLATMDLGPRWRLSMIFVLPVVGAGLGFWWAWSVL